MSADILVLKLIQRTGVQVLVVTPEAALAGGAIRTACPGLG